MAVGEDKTEDVITYGDLARALTKEGDFDPSRIAEFTERINKLKEGVEQLNMLDQARAYNAGQRLKALADEEKLETMINLRKERRADLEKKHDFISKERLKVINKEIKGLEEIKRNRGNILTSIKRNLAAQDANLKKLEQEIKANNVIETQLKRIQNLYAGKIGNNKKELAEMKGFGETVARAFKSLTELEPGKLLEETSAENLFIKQLTGVEGITYTDYLSALDAFTNSMDTGFRGVVRSGFSFSDDLKKVFEAGVDPIEMASGRQRFLSQELVDDMGGMFTRLGLDGEAMNRSLMAAKTHISTMRDEFIKSSPANAAAAAHFVNLTAGLNKLGVAEEHTAANLDLFMKGMKQTPKEASESVRALTKVAHTLDISVAQSFADFNSIQGELAQYGDDTVRVFGDLQAQAVATGVDVNTLNSVASKLDTFKGAAQAAQGFNAVLGKTVLSVTDLVHAEPAEKIELLKDALDRSGMSFDTANRRVKAIIANMLGIDVAKASKLFGSEEDYFQLKSNLDGSSDSMEELEKRAEASMTVAEKMKKSMSSLGKASSEAIDRARINAEKASETLMTVIGGLGEKAKTAEEVLLGLRGALQGVAVVEQKAEMVIGTAKDVAGWAAVGTIIYNMLSKPMADKLVKRISQATGVDEDTIKENIPGAKKRKTKPAAPAPTTTKPAPAPTPSAGTSLEAGAPGAVAQAVGPLLPQTQQSGPLNLQVFVDNELKLNQVLTGAGAVNIPAVRTATKE